jgi:hypothetical protein
MKYLVAFAWGVSLATGIVGDTAMSAVQHLFVVLLGFTHIFIIAVVIGRQGLCSPYLMRSVQSVLAQMNRSSMELRDRMLQLNYYMEQRNLPEDLQRRIRTVCNHACLTRCACLFMHTRLSYHSNFLEL